MSSSSIPLFFTQFVKNIETPNYVKVFLQFKDQDELKKCAAFYFNRAVVNPNLAAQFAVSAEKFKSVWPAGGDPKFNFRKALAHETRSQTENILECLSSASNLSEARASAVFKFTGELFNVGFIMKETIKNLLDLLSYTKDSCLTSYRSYYMLIDTVKKRISEEQDEYNIIHRALLEMIKSAETPPKPPTVVATPKTLTKTSFPELINSTKPAPVKSFEDKIENFKSIIDKLNPSNSSMVVKEVTEGDKICYEEGKWQKYYEILIEKAVEMPDVAFCIVTLCTKISKLPGEAWKGIKSEDYKKFIQQTVINKLEKSFEGNNNNEAYSVLTFIEKLLDQSLCSLTCILSFFNVLIENADKNESVASRNLIQLVSIVKTTFTSEKIKKLPEDNRRKVLEIISNAKGVQDLQQTASYFGIEWPKVETREGFQETSEDSGTSTSSYSVSRKSSIEDQEWQELVIPTCSDFFIPEDDKLPGADCDNEWDVDGRDSITVAIENEGSIADIEEAAANGPLNSPIAESIKMIPVLTSSSSSSHSSSRKGSPQAYSNLSPIPRLDLIDMALNNTINFGCVEECVRQIEKIGIKRPKELDYLVDALIREVMRVINGNNIKRDIENYGKLAFAITELDFKTDEPQKFQEKLIKKCEDIISDRFNPKLEAAKCNETYSLTQFISELYILGVADLDLIKLCMDLFFRQELTCMFAVYCINIMIRTIGPNLTGNKQKLFDRYFEFFRSIKHDTTYRSKVYRELIELRRSQWLNSSEPFEAPEEEVVVILNPNITPNIEDKSLLAVGKSNIMLFERLESRTEKEKSPKIEEKFTKVVERPEKLENVTEKLDVVEKPKKLETEIQLPKIEIKTLTFDKNSLNDQEKLQKFISELKIQLSSFSRVESFIYKLLQRSLNDRKFISSCVKIFKQIKDISENFIDTLIEKLMISYATTFRDIDKKFLSNLFIIFAELYREDILADENLAIWSFHKHLKHIAPEDLSYISSILTPKVQEKGDDHVKALLASLENPIHTKMMEDCTSMATDISDVISFMLEKSRI